MEASTLAVLVLVLVVGYFFVKSRRSDKRSHETPVRPVRPEVPDHKAEKDGDVNNGVTFSSFSAAFAPAYTVVNAIKLKDNNVIATQQIEQNLRDSFLGNVVKAEEELPEPLENYTFKATVLGDRLLPNFPTKGTLADVSTWTMVLNQEPRPFEQHATIGSILRPVHSRIYLEVKAPEGYKDGVVILDLLTETGM